MIKVKVSFKVGTPIIGYADLPDIVAGADFGKYLLVMKDTTSTQSYLVPVANINYMETVV